MARQPRKRKQAAPKVLAVLEQPDRDLVRSRYLAMIGASESLRQGQEQLAQLARIEEACRSAYTAAVEDVRARNGIAEGQFDLDFTTGEVTPTPEVAEVA